jgi:PIN domain nuclease of toxin-antitoxin system
VARGEAGATDRRPARARARIEEDDLFVPPMVALELAYLLETGRIVPSPQDVLTGLAADIGLAVCDKPSGSIVLRAQSFTWTRDPFDRIITAQAAFTSSDLITKDDVIRSNHRPAVWD